jgi:cytochrome o ubiquinol oxidase subunit IV
MAHTQSLHVEEGHGSLGSYVIGFLLSVVLTGAAFGLVQHHLLPPQSSLLPLAVLALVQIVVHLVFFLHTNTSSGQRWNLLALGYTTLAALFLVFGTVWVMHNVSMMMMSR